MNESYQEKCQYVEKLARVLNDEDRKEFSALLIQKGLTKNSDEESKIEALNLKSKYSNQNFKLRMMSGGLQNFVAKLNAKIEPPVYPHYIKCLLMAICFVVGLYYGYIYSLDLIKNKPLQAANPSSEQTPSLQYVKTPAAQARVVKKVSVQEQSVKSQPVQSSSLLYALKGAMNNTQFSDPENSPYINLLDSLLDQAGGGAHSSAAQLTPVEEEVYVGEIHLNVPKDIKNKTVEFKYATLEVKNTGLSKVSLGGPFNKGETLFIELHRMKVNHGSGYIKKISDKNANVLYNIDDVVLGALNSNTGKFIRLARVPSTELRKRVEYLCEDNFQELFLIYRAKTENNFAGFLEYYYWIK